jgi:hypothetical protein
MHLRKTLATTATALTLSTGGLIALAGPARATPICAGMSTWTSGTRSYVRVSNDCSYRIRFRVIWNRAFDGSCTTLDPGWYRTESRGRQASVERLKDC